MIVKCDKCGQEYDVNESRVSSQGARIKCPSCSNIFLVKKKKGLEEPPAPPKVEEEPEVKETEKDVTWRIHHIGLTYTFHDLESLRDWLSGRNSLENVKIAKGDDDWGELGDYREVMTTELITRFFPLGDVPTTESKAKSEIAGALEAGSDKRDAIGLDSLRSASTTGMAMAAPISISSNLNNVVNSTSFKNQKAVRKQQLRLEAEKKQMRKKWIAVGIFLFVLVVCAVVALRMMRGESMDNLTKTSSNEETSVAAPQTNAPTAEVVAEKKASEPVAEKAVEPEPTPSLSEEEIQRMEEEAIQTQYEEAAAMVQKRQWPEARATLESLLKQRPEHLKALQLLATTYRGLELNDKVAEIEAQIKRVKSAQK